MLQVPLFPLPNVLLYPSAILPLHVFEPRYIQMVEDLVAKGEDRVVLGLLQDGWEDGYFGEPPVHPIAGLGRLLHTGAKVDGRYNILLQGIERVRIRDEVVTDTLYRQVQVEPVEELAHDDPGAEAVRLALRDGLIDFADGSLMVEARAPLGYLADVLLVALPNGIEEKQALFEILDQRTRAERVLEVLRSTAQDRQDYQNLPDSPPAWN
ncbi:MAG: LON peptidase substrate-binding domain-containing protein [Planctomycetes bacterium]|nr:LON peptidase substrate-binding domain-containing protein [Planctomycetota bacterium]